MTQTVRTVLPTDLVALVSYDGRVYANEAMTRDRIGSEDSPHPIGAAFEQWFSFATGRHTWISVKGPTLRGLLSARKRGSRLAWEIDCLINAGNGDDGVLMSLLDQMTQAAGKSGALKIFVRLPRACPLERAVARCGFVPGTAERVYRRPSAPDQNRSLPDGLRRRTKDDLFALFQLYNAITPIEIRQKEAMTLAEWVSAQETLGSTSQYVLDRGGVRGWLRVAGDGDIGRFDVLAQPRDLDELLRAALAKT